MLDKTIVNAKIVSNATKDIHIIKNRHYIGEIVVINSRYRIDDGILRTLETSQPYRHDDRNEKISNIITRMYDNSEVLNAKIHGDNILIIELGEYAITFIIDNHNKVAHNISILEKSDFINYAFFNVTTNDPDIRFYQLIVFPHRIKIIIPKTTKKMDHGFGIMYHASDIDIDLSKIIPGHIVFDIKPNEDIDINVANSTGDDSIYGEVIFSVLIKSMLKDTDPDIVPVIYTHTASFRVSEKSRIVSVENVILKETNEEVE